MCIIVLCFAGLGFCAPSDVLMLSLWPPTCTRHTQAPIYLLTAGFVFAGSRNSHSHGRYFLCWGYNIFSFLERERFFPLWVSSFSLLPQLLFYFILFHFIFCYRCPFCVSICLLDGHYSDTCLHPTDMEDGVPAFGLRSFLRSLSSLGWFSPCHAPFIMGSGAATLTVSSEVSASTCPSLMHRNVGKLSLSAVMLPVCIGDWLA